MTPTLPSGLTTRPLGMRDATAVTAVMAEQQRADLGEVAIEEADIIADWGRPSFDVASGAVGVFDGDRLVGYAEHSGLDRGDASVHPAYLGRDIGTWLAHWMQERARADGQPRVGMPVPQGSPGDRLLADLGYHVRWTSWILRLPAGAQVPDRGLPAGYQVRQGEESELPAIHDVVEDAFLEWSDRPREPLEDFRAKVTGRPGFAPWLLRVVNDPSGAIVGVATLTRDGRTVYVERLAVRVDQRGQGLAQVLLIDSFRVGREHGAEVLELSTDSRTGALPLYEKVGMVVRMTWVNRAIELR